MTINTGKTVAFGQGLYQIQACSQWVSITLNDEYLTAAQSDTGTAGNYVNAIYIQGLDAVHCRNTSFDVQLYNQVGSSSAMNIYEGAYGPSTVAAITIGNATDQFSQTQLLENGQPSKDSTNYETLSYISTTGTYVITFANPLALSSQVGNVTVQSTGTRN
jgi:hypothetical protein